MTNLLSDDRKSSFWDFYPRVVVVWICGSRKILLDLAISAPRKWKKKKFLRRPDPTQRNQKKVKKKIWSFDISLLNRGELSVNDGRYKKKKNNGTNRLDGIGKGMGQNLGTWETLGRKDFGLWDMKSKAL